MDRLAKIGELISIQEQQKKDKKSKLWYNDTFDKFYELELEELDTIHELYVKKNKHSR